MQYIGINVISSGGGTGSSTTGSTVSTSVCYLLGGSGVTCPRGVVAGVGGFRSPAASTVEPLPED